MRILIASDIFPPESGGPATYVVSLADALLEAGHEVKIVTLNERADISQTKAPVFVSTAKGKLRRYFRYTDVLVTQAKHADVIYAMGPVNAGLPAFIAAKIMRTPLVVKVVGDYAWEQGIQRFDVADGIDEFQQGTKYPWQVRALKWVESWVVRRADSVIVPSEYLRKMVVDWGAKEENVHTVYNAVKFLDVEKMIKLQEERRLVFVGRLVAWKGVDTLIEIMPDLLAVDPHIRLQVIGDGPMMKYLRNLVHVRSLGDYVAFLGQLPREEALRYVASADAFLLNTGYEGLSHVALEAMSYGIPVLASTKGGNPEIVVRGKTGDLYEYDNRREITEVILRSLAEPPVDSGWIDSGVGKMFFDQFRFDTMIEETEKHLNILTSKHTNM